MKSLFLFPLFFGLFLSSVSDANHAFLGSSSYLATSCSGNGGGSYCSQRAVANKMEDPTNEVSERDIKDVFFKVTKDLKIEIDTNTALNKYSLVKTLFDATQKKGLARQLHLVALFKEQFQNEMFELLTRKGYPQVLASSATKILLTEFPPQEFIPLLIKEISRVNGTKNLKEIPNVETLKSKFLFQSLTEFALAMGNDEEILYLINQGRKHDPKNTFYIEAEKDIPKVKHLYRTLFNAAFWDKGKNTSSLLIKRSIAGSERPLNHRLALDVLASFSAASKSLGYEIDEKKIKDKNFDWATTIREQASSTQTSNPDLAQNKHFNAYLSSLSEGLRKAGYPKGLAARASKIAVMDSSDKDKLLFHLSRIKGETNIESLSKLTEINKLGWKSSLEAVINEAIIWGNDNQIRFLLEQGKRLDPDNAYYPYLLRNLRQIKHLYRTIYENTHADEDSSRNPDKLNKELPVLSASPGQNAYIAIEYGLKARLASAMLRHAGAIHGKSLAREWNNSYRLYLKSKLAKVLSVSPTDISIAGPYFTIKSGNKPTKFYAFKDRELHLLKTDIERSVARQTYLKALIDALLEEDRITLDQYNEHLRSELDRTIRRYFGEKELIVEALKKVHPKLPPSYWNKFLKDKDN